MGPLKKKKHKRSTQNARHYCYVCCSEQPTALELPPAPFYPEQVLKPCKACRDLIKESGLSIKDYITKDMDDFLGLGTLLLTLTNTRKDGTYYNERALKKGEKRRKKDKKI